MFKLKLSRFKKGSRRNHKKNKDGKTCNGLLQRKISQYHVRPLVLEKTTLRILCVDKHGRQFISQRKCETLNFFLPILCCLCTIQCQKIFSLPQSTKNTAFTFYSALQDMVMYISFLLNNVLMCVNNRKILDIILFL